MEREMTPDAQGRSTPPPPRRQGNGALLGPESSPIYGTMVPPVAPRPMSPPRPVSSQSSSSSPSFDFILSPSSTSSSALPFSSHLITPLPLALERSSQNGDVHARPLLTRKLSATSKAFQLALEQCEESSSSPSASAPFHADDSSLDGLVLRRRRLCRRLMCCCWSRSGYESLSQDDDHLEPRSPPSPDPSSSIAMPLHHHHHHQQLGRLERGQVELDGRRIVLLCTLVMGAALVVPLQLFTTTLDYFDLIFVSSPEDEESFRYYFPLVNFSALLAGSLITTYHGRSWSLTNRLCSTTLVTVVLLLLIPLYVGPRLEAKSMNESTALVLSFSVVAFTSVATSIYQSTLYGVAAVFGPTFTNAVEVGKGYSAVLIVLLRILLKLYLSNDENIPAVALPRFIRRSTYIFFILGCCILFLAVIAYFVLLHVPIACDLLAPFYSPPPSSSSSAATAASEKEPTLSHLSALMRQPHLHGRALEVGSSVPVHRYETFLPVDAQSSSSRNRTNLRMTLTDEVAPSVAGPALCAFLSFAVCVSAFPSLSLSFKSSVGTADADDWLHLKLVLSFCVADLLGKSLPFATMPFTARNVWIPALSNTLALPLLFVLRFRSTSLIPPASPPTLLSAALQSDVVKCLAVAFLGATTGYGTTAANMLAPMSVAPSFKPLAAECMQIVNMAGLFAGSAIGVSFCKLTA